MLATTDDTPLRPVCDTWLALLKKAETHRRSKFGETAELCRRFYLDSHDFLYKPGKGREKLGIGDEVAAPSFAMTVNKVAELVQIFGPSLYAKDPHRHVLSRRVPLPPAAMNLLYPDPMQAQAVAQMHGQTAMADGVVADLLSKVLNYLPREFGHKKEARLSIDDALIAGGSFSMSEMVRTDSGVLLPQSYHMGWERVFIDPDATSLRDATWVMVQYDEPYWQVERELRLPQGLLKKAAKRESKSREAQGEVNDPSGYSRVRGHASDLLRYYKVFSKSGMGHRVSGPTIDSGAGEGIERLREVLEGFGDNCFLIVAEGIPYPLNLPPDVQNADLDIPGNEDDLNRRVKWPVPFYADGGWPVSELFFHPIPGEVWPMAHLRPAMGEMVFLDWAFSWLAGRTQLTSRTFVAIADHVDEHIKDRIKSGADLEVLEFKALLQKKLSEVIEFVQFPEVNPDMWNLIDRVSLMFDKRTGLTDLLYGMAGKQMRSASEAQVREQATNVRPDDMADSVEDWEGVKAKKEAMMLRWNNTSADVAPIFREQPTGEGPFSMLWDALVSSPLNYDDPQSIERVVREYEYTITAGSVRKPNLERDQANLDQMAQIFLPVFVQERQMTGNAQQLNAFMGKWGELHQMPVDELMFAPLPPPPPPMPPGQEQPQPQVA